MKNATQILNGGNAKRIKTGGLELVKKSPISAIFAILKNRFDYCNYIDSVRKYRLKGMI